MGVLMWDKPKRAMAKDQWKEAAGFDGGPDGGYQPNMSKADELAWKAKITGTKLGYPQVEIRKRAGDTLMLIIVNLGAGYNYKGRRADFDWKEAQSYVDYYAQPHYGQPGKQVNIGHVLLSNVDKNRVNVHISMNGPALFDFTTFAEMQTAIDEARTALEAFETAPGERQRHYLMVDDTAVEASLSAIAGVRVHQVIPSLNMLVISCPETSIPTIMATQGVERFRDAADVRRESHDAIWGKDDD